VLLVSAERSRDTTGRSEVAIETFVFSYNRGRFLANLLRSARDCGWVAPITIVDDRSDDRTTQRVLANAERHDNVRVVVPPRERTDKYGGFWANMRLAYEELATARHVMFLQDDLQFVRPVGERDIERSIELLEDPRLSPFLFPAFWWGARGRQHEYRDHYPYDSHHDIYRRSDSSVQPGFADVAIFDRHRLDAVGWQAGRSETHSNADAFSRFGAMTLHPDPFIAFVPFAPRFRHGNASRLRVDPRRLPLPARLRVMSTAENGAFLARGRDALPVAADHLRPAGPIRRRLLRDAYWES
jgi:glycosyltransferase involved in cell wall biosynthesis